MKQRKDREFYLKRAREGFRVMVYYYNITRPVHAKEYQRNGKFSPEEFGRQMKFLSTWNERSATSRKELARTYARYSSTFNYVCGVPREIVESLNVVFIDEDGKRRRLGIDEIAKPFIESGEVKVVNAGSRLERQKDGSLKKKCWWCKKYILANEVQRYRMFNDRRWHAIETFPVDVSKEIEHEGYARMMNAILKFYKVDKKEKKTSHEFSLDVVKKAYVIGVLDDFKFKTIGSAMFGMDEDLYEKMLQYKKEHPELDVKDISRLNGLERLFYARMKESGLVEKLEVGSDARILCERGYNRSVKGMA